MNGFCPYCGTQIAPGSNVCGNCGRMVNNQANAARPTITKRSIGVTILLSLITCGIYGLYWFVCLTNDSNAVSDTDKTASGGMAILLTILTCGIYSFYWSYKLGKKLYNAGQKYNVAISDNSVIYLVLGIFGLGIVTYCIAQSDLNKLAQ